MDDVTQTSSVTNVDATPAESVPSDRVHTLSRRVEALLFVAPTPVKLADLARSLDVSAEEAEMALDALANRLEGSGLALQRLGDRLQLVTAPDLAEDVERFLGLEISGKLSSAALETLAIIAYRQPITRAEIEAIRGVNSDGVLRSLLNKGLIEEVGRKETVGRPILYGTSMAFLQHFGLRDISELPPLEKLSIHAQTLEQALQEVEARDKTPEV